MFSILPLVENEERGKRKAERVSMKRIIQPGTIKKPIQDA
jgi:hypothetical protein